MSKYDPLGAFLKAGRGERIAMTFAEIEEVLGFPLPSSKAYPAWWSNNPTNNVMTRVWLDAGYRTEQVDPEAERLVFRRVGPAPQPGFSESPATPLGAQPGGGPKRHPLFGTLKGRITVAVGVDLTEPADPHWGEQP